MELTLKFSLLVAYAVALLAVLAVLPADAASAAAEVTTPSHPNAPYALGDPLTATARQLQATKSNPPALPVPLLAARPRLGRASTPRKGATTPTGNNVCQARIAAANKTATEVCGMAGVTLPGCMYSCREQQRTSERCICCWPGLQLLDNTCEACPVGTFAKVSGANTCQACPYGYSTYSTASIACNVCAAGYGVPRRDFGQPVWTCAKCPLGTYSPGNSTTACTKCGDGLTTAAAGATAPVQCIPAVCSSPPLPLPGIPSWPASCANMSSCTAACSGNFTGSVTVSCGPGNTWLQPTQPCQQESPGAGDLSSQLSLSPPLITLGSKGLLNFTMNFIKDLAAAAGDVKLFTSDAAGKPLTYIADMQQQSIAPPPSSSSSVYSVSLALQGPQLGSLSSSPGVRLFTVVVGADNKATGATAQLELIAGCAEGPSAAAPPEAFPWNATACAASAVGQQCLTNCRWPSYDGPGYWATCLGDGTWSAPGGLCFPRSCSGSPGPEWANSSCPYTPVGLQCNAPCPNGLIGTGYSAVCSISGWQVLSTNCSDDTSCRGLPTQETPAGSKGWDPGCPGRDSGAVCTATCDINFFGPGYTATCSEGVWTVQAGGNCRVCSSGTSFGGTAGNLPDLGTTGDILATSGGKILVGDATNKRIVIYSAATLAYEGSWQTTRNRVIGVSGTALAERSDGNILAYQAVTSTTTDHSVEELSPTGALVTSYSTPYTVVFGLAVTSNGDTLGAARDYEVGQEAEGVLRWPGVGISSRPTELPKHVPSWTPRAVAVDKRSGTIVATDPFNRYIVIYNSAGNTILRSVIVPYEPGEVAVGFGKIFVIDRDAATLRVYDSRGNYLGRYGGPMAPTGLDVDTDGVVWVANTLRFPALSYGLRITCFQGL